MDRMSPLRQSNMTTESSPAIRLQQPWLTVARLTWMVLTGMVVTVTLSGLPTYYRTLTTSNLTFFLSPDWTPALFSAALDALNLTPGLIVGYVIALDMLRLLVFVGIGLLIFWRLSDQWLGLFASYVLVYIGMAIGNVPAWLFDLPLFWHRLLNIPLYIGWPAFFVFLNLYPNGRYVPGWLRFATPLWFLFGIALSVFFDSSDNSTVPALWPLLGFVLVITGISGQIYRYLRIADRIERLQVRWFLFSTLIVFGTLILSQYVLSPGFDGTTPDALVFRLFDHFLQDVFFCLIPLSIAVAIFRYRLWDIDVIIRRTLTYSAITAVLAAAYFGAVTILQGMSARFIGGDSPLAIVASTLLIAALFTPLRRRVQDFVDRRFYRQKYDSTRTLESFSDVARDEVDLGELQQALVRVVDGTMQPEHISLWLREGERHNR